MNLRMFPRLQGLGAVPENKGERNVHSVDHVPGYRDWFQNRQASILGETQPQYSLGCRIDAVTESSTTSGRRSRETLL